MMDDLFVYVLLMAYMMMAGLPSSRGLRLEAHEDFLG